MTSGCSLNILLLLFVLSTNLLNSLHAQNLPNSPLPAAPSPLNRSPSPTPTPNSPTPTPIHSPSPSPAPSSSPSPHPNAPTPNLSPPPIPDVPAPAPPVIGRGDLSGLSGAQKAGIVIGTLLGAAVLVSLGMVYMKRKNNIRRSRYSDAARNFDL